VREPAKTLARVFHCQDIESLCRVVEVASVGQAEATRSSLQITERLILCENRNLNRNPEIDCRDVKGRTSISVHSGANRSPTVARSRQTSVVRAILGPDCPNQTLVMTPYGQHGSQLDSKLVTIFCTATRLTGSHKLKLALKVLP
jgi:hypothetical protein